jgi:hypothetical protein
MADNKILYEDTKRLNELAEAREFLSNVQEVIESLKAKKIHISYNIDLKNLFADPLGAIRYKLHHIFTRQNETAEIPMNPDLQVNMVDFSQYDEIIEKINRIPQTAKDIIHLDQNGAVSINESKYRQLKEAAQIKPSNEAEKRAAQAYLDLMKALNQAQDYTKILTHYNEVDREFLELFNINARREFNLDKAGLLKFMKKAS